MDQAQPLQLVPASEEELEDLSEMARRIWRLCYVPDMLTLDAAEYLWQRGYRPDALREQMRLGAEFRWIQRLCTPVGFLSYRLDCESNCLWLNKLYLLPECHGQGIGAFALSEVKRAAATLKAAEIRLYVFKKNERAIRAYRRAGFEILCEDFSHAGNGYFYDDYVMFCRMAADPVGAPPG